MTKQTKPIPLLLKPRRGIAEVLENYKQYWFDNFDDFADKILPKVSSDF